MKLLILTLVFAALSTGSHSAAANELRDGDSGQSSEGMILLTLDLLPRPDNGLRFVSGSEVVSSLLPEFLASSLLASRSISFGVCPPDIYRDGFAVSAPLSNSTAVSSLMTAPVRVRLQQAALENSESDRSLNVTACGATRGSEVFISLQSIEGLYAPKVLVGKLMLLIKPE